MLDLEGSQVKLLHDMIELYSPTGQEGKLAQFLVKEMRSRGLWARLDGVGNVVGESDGSGPSFLLCGHMDTVPGILPIRVDGSRLYGRGAVDAKPALAAMICAAGILVAEGFMGRLIVVGSIDEEGKGRGVRKLIKDGVLTDYAVFGEPSGVENITIAYKGSLHLKVTCETRTGHSSAPWLFRNAVEEAFDLWEKLCRIRFPEEKPESKFYSLTSTIIGIKGGDASSTVPSLCELSIDFRLPPAVPPQRLLDELLKTVETFRLSRPDVAIRLEVEDSNEPCETDRDSVLVRGLSWAVREVRGKTATLLRKTGTGDMNLLNSTLPIPMVTYGAGDSRLDHTSDEYVDLNEYLDSIRILHKGLARTLELHNRLKQGNACRLDSTRSSKAIIRGEGMQ